MGAILAALFYSLTSSEFLSVVSSAKTDLQAEVRQAIDWIAKDVRQTNLIQINTNNPSGSHIKFKKVTGIDNSTGNYALSDNYIEYDYDAVSGDLVRNEVDDGGTILQSWVFHNITQAPFYSSQGVVLAPGDILNSKKLVVVIAGQGQVRSSLTLNFSLTGEVKIRNE